MSTIREIPLDKLQPRTDQPRQHYGEEGIQSLADSIRAAGFQGSITARLAPGGNGCYEILAGHRRTRAARKAGLQEIPCTVTDLDDEEARQFVLLDNLNREDFLPWEEGAGYAELVDLGSPVESVASKAGKSVTHVRNRIRISEEAGEAARRAYLADEIALVTLQALCDLPDTELAPCECPQCGVVCGDGVSECPACGGELENAIRVPGNPQATAVKLAKGKSTDAAEELIEKVKQSYGLAEEATQTNLALSFDDERVSPDTLRTRSKLEREIARIGGRLEKLLQNGNELEGLPRTARETIAQQCEVGVRALQRIQEMVTHVAV